MASISATIRRILRFSIAVSVDRTVYRDPSLILSLNRQLGLADYHRALADSAGLLDEACSADGVHPTPAGYARMQIELRRCLKQLGFDFSRNETVSP